MATLGDLMVRIGVPAEQVDRDLNRVQGFFQRHSEKMAAAGAAIGAGAGAAIGVGVTQALETDRLGDKLAAQLGATGPEAQRLGEVSGDLYAQGLGSGLEEVDNAVGAVVSSIDGMRTASAETVEATSKKALSLAQAFEVDVARAAQVAGQTVKSGLVKDVDQGLDLITASMQKVPAAVREDLLDAVDEYGPFMNQIGVTGQKAFNLLVAAADKGAFGLDKTGDALKEFTLLSTDMSDRTQEAYKSLGMNAEQMTKDLLAGGDRGSAAFQKIVSGLLSIKDPVKQSQAALALFGTPLEDLSTQDIPKFLATLDTTADKLGDTTGAADKLGQTLNDNAATGIESWKRRTEQALGSLAGAPGIMGDTAQAATGITQALAPMGADLGGLAMAALAGAKIFPAVAKGAATMAMMVGRSVMTVTVGAAKMTASMTMTAARFVAGWVLMGAQALLGAARVALAWLIAMGPIALVIAAVIGLVVLVVKYWDQIKAVIGKGWDWVRSRTQAAWAWIVNLLKNNWDRILMVIGGPLGIIIALVIKNWGRIRAITTTVWNAIVGGVRTAVRGVLAAVGWIAQLPGRVATWFLRLHNAAVQRAVGLVSWLKGLPGRILRAVGSLNTLLAQAGRNVIQGLINGIMSMIGRVKGAIGNVTQTIRNYLPFSPAKLGPLSGSGSPDLAGQKIGTMLADGLATSVTAVAASSEKLATAASIDPEQLGTSRKPANGGLGTSRRPAGGASSAGASYKVPAVARVAPTRIQIEIRGDGSRYGDLLVEELRQRIKIKGGDVQVVLGTKKRMGTSRR